MSSRSVLILAAGVGRGHQSAADGLRDELLRIAPDVLVTVHTGLGAAHGPPRVFLEPVRQLARTVKKSRP